jgi:tRNA pseudouridine55 synthase
VSPDGLLIVDKSGGMTSHDVVGATRRALATRKVGHAGTLDPMATGVLLLGIGRATRLLGHLALADKEYTATIRLGASTVTDDADGDLLATAPAAAVQALDDADLREQLARMVGVIRQRPSAVSAIKVDGKRAYDLVRSGADVDLPERTVTVTRIDVDDIRWLPGFVDVDVTVECSTGTYIRAIARDLGDELGVGGHLTALRRTRVGAFGLDEAVPLDGIRPEAVLPLDAAAARCFPVWTLDAPGDQRSVVNGVRLAWAGPATDAPVAIMSGDGGLLALATDDSGRARYLAVFG